MYLMNNNIIIKSSSIIDRNLIPQLPYLESINDVNILKRSQLKHLAFEQIHHWAVY